MAIASISGIAVSNDLALFLPDFVVLNHFRNNFAFPLLRVFLPDSMENRIAIPI